MQLSIPRRRLVMTVALSIVASAVLTVVTLAASQAPAQASTLGDSIASIALAEASNSALGHNREANTAQAPDNCTYYSTLASYGYACGNGLLGGWGYEWCSVFVKWVFGQAGASTTGINTYASSLKTYGVNNGTWHSRSSGYTPQPGDTLVFDWTPYNGSRDGVIDHVGIVRYASGGRVYTVEGNTSAQNSNDDSEGVFLKDYAMSYGDIVGYTSPVGPGSGGGGGGSPLPGTYLVDTYDSAPGYASPGGGSSTGTLYAGTNYVYCKAWGPQVGSGTSYNHWWLKTDLDIGPANQYVSAYYLSLWGNDEAKDNSGTVIPDCAGGSSPPPTTTPPPPPTYSQWWVDMFANAPGYSSPGSGSSTGTLYAGTSYVYCRVWGPQVGSGGSYNHWWLKTDLDVGPGNQYVSAYYLSRWGNDVAKDNNGTDIPNC